MNHELIAIIESIHNSHYVDVRKILCRTISNKLIIEDVPTTSVCLGIECINCVCWGGYSGTYGRNIIQMSKIYE